MIRGWGGKRMRVFKPEELGGGQLSFLWPKSPAPSVSSTPCSVWYALYCQQLLGQAFRSPAGFCRGRTQEFAAWARFWPCPLQFHPSRIPPTCSALLYWRAWSLDLLISLFWNEIFTQRLKLSPKQPNYWWVMLLMNQFGLFLFKLLAILLCPLIFSLIIIFRFEIHQSHQNNLNWNDVLL